MVTVKDKGWPAQTGEVVLITGVAGIGLIETVEVTGAEEQPLSEVTSVYTPELADVAFGIVGFCRLLVNSAGPVQA